MVSDTRDAVATYTGKNGSKVPGIIDSQEDNKPADAPADWSAWPTLESKECPTDADGDGMPDVWELANGLNPNDASDRNTTNAEGYTMLEVYMNSIVADIMANEVADGVADGIRQGEQTTGVSSVSKSVIKAECVDVYSRNGLLLKKNVSRNEAMNLPKGVYVIGGEKVLVD